MAKQSRSAPVMRAVLDAVGERLMVSDESLIRIPEICEATGVNYGSVYYHFGSREGVINAAYNLLFEDQVDEGIASVRYVSETAKSLEEFVELMQPIRHMVSSGEQRMARRAIRARIVGAAMMRPDLRFLIGSSPVRLTNELFSLIGFAQEQGWLRSDVTPRAIAVATQAVVFGRSLDDVSLAPIDDDEWEHGMAVVLSSMLNLP